MILTLLMFHFSKKLIVVHVKTMHQHFSPCTVSVFKIHMSQNLLYQLSVSADMEKFLSVIYRYRPIRKFVLSVVIGIGRYGKKHIDRTLPWLVPTNNKRVHVLKLTVVNRKTTFKNTRTALALLEK